MHRYSHLYDSIVAFQSRCKPVQLVHAYNGLQRLRVEEVSETHGYPRKSRLSTEWFLQRLTSVQQSTQPHMVSRLSRAAIRNT